MSDGNDENINGNLKAEIESDFNYITPLIYSSLESAHQISPECVKLITERSDYKNEFPLIAGKINRAVYPSLMRAITQYLLNLHNIKTKAENWKCDVLINNGLSGECENRKYKILKVFRFPVLNIISGEYDVQLKIPPSGNSQKRRRFFNQDDQQQLIWDFGESSNYVKLPKYNACYLWDASTSDSFNLYLACPKACGLYYTEDYFLEPISHPIFNIKPPLPDIEDIIEDIDLPKLDFGQAPKTEPLDIEDNSDEQNGDNEEDLNEDD